MEIIRLFAPSRKGAADPQPHAHPHSHREMRSSGLPRFRRDVLVAACAALFATMGNAVYNFVIEPKRTIAYNAKLSPMLARANSSRYEVAYEVEVANTGEQDAEDAAITISAPSDIDLSDASFSPPADVAISQPAETKSQNARVIRFKRIPRGHKITVHYSLSASRPLPAGCVTAIVIPPKNFKVEQLQAMNSGRLRGPSFAPARPELAVAFSPMPAPVAQPVAYDSARSQRNSATSLHKPLFTAKARTHFLQPVALAPEPVTVAGFSSHKFFNILAANDGCFDAPTSPADAVTLTPEKKPGVVGFHLSALMGTWMKPSAPQACDGETAFVNANTESAPASPLACAVLRPGGAKLKLHSMVVYVVDGQVFIANKPWDVAYLTKGDSKLDITSKFMF